MDRPLKILFVTAEMSPLISTGGLAEVANALPKALHARGHDVRVIMPCFREIPEEHRGESYCLCVADLGSRAEHGALRRSVVPGTEIPLYLVEHEGFFGRATPYGTGASEFPDNAERFCFFCQAVLHGIPQTWWKPDIVHCHDWHAASVPVYLRSKYQKDAYWEGVSSLLTIHNLGYQGQYPAEKFENTGFDDELLSPEFLEFHGDLNLLKGGIVFAGRLNTVSPRYAREIQTPEYGAGMDGVLRTRRDHLTGILNGVDYDTWNPAIDGIIAAPYARDALAGKQACKKRLQEMAGLPVKDTPVFGVVSRLYWQKGLDLVVDALRDLMKLDVQLVVLGSGEPGLERRLRQAQQEHPDRVHVLPKYEQDLARHVFAGSDFFLMPSRYEPCGLGQMYALAYGAVPIVRRTGGLSDTVRDVNGASLKDGSAN
ncbi:MAG: glycogen synthase, partial [Candidatus Hydrogenedentes bacterium]|nr:glycogen synthase [Candidatus Hydrogenedentota bacterium]